MIILCETGEFFIADVMLALFVLFAVMAAFAPIACRLSTRQAVITLLLITIAGIGGCLWSLL